MKRFDALFEFDFELEFDVGNCVCVLLTRLFPHIAYTITLHLRNSRPAPASP